MREILSTAAFCIINSKWFCYPGAIFPDIVSMYLKSSKIKHGSRQLKRAFIYEI